MKQNNIKDILNYEIHYNCITCNKQTKDVLANAIKSNINKSIANSPYDFLFS